VFAEDVALAVGLDKLVFAIDSKQGRVAIEGWRQLTSVTPLHMITALERWCTAFLYTHIDTEGLMQGIPLDTVSQLRASTKRQLIVAGGIASSDQIDELDALRIDAVVGMAIYTGRMRLGSWTSRPEQGVTPKRQT
jgi:phosphoribosylformimino-5-aminoimidazole carboxamide ribotide isomerase